MNELVIVLDAMVLAGEIKQSNEVAKEKGGSVERARQAHAQTTNKSKAKMCTHCVDSAAKFRHTQCVHIFFKFAYKAGPAP